MVFNLDFNKKELIFKKKSFVFKKAINFNGLLKEVRSQRKLWQSVINKSILQINKLFELILSLNNKLFLYQLQTYLNIFQSQLRLFIKSEYNSPIVIALVLTNQVILTILDLNLVELQTFHQPTLFEQTHTHPITSNYQSFLVTHLNTHLYKSFVIINSLKCIIILTFFR